MKPEHQTNDSVVVDINAVDTLVFRDGRAFTQADAEAAAHTSVFPPYPPTVVGTVRLAVAVSLGFGAGASWPSEMLGDGVDWQKPGQLGEAGKSLQFSAPVVTQNGACLFPAPLSVLADDKGCRSRLKPGSRRFECDLNADVRLPELADVPAEGGDGLKPLSSAWFDLKTMEHFLSDQPASELMPVLREDILTAEPRVGIGLESEARTAIDGQLFAAGHLRPQHGFGLRVEVKGLKPLKTPRLQTVGGEHRMASIAMARGSLSLPSCPPIEDGRYLVLAVSPLLLPKAPRPGTAIAGLPGAVVSACLGKPIRIGGWDGKARRPIPMRQAIPAGSVIFMECASGTKAQSLHGKHIGEATEWGFGQILIGRWSEAEA